MPVRFGWLGAGLVVLFAAAAVLNSGGYQYGAADQAFYLPAILSHLHPELFPRDRSLIAAEDNLMLLTRAVAGLAGGTGLPLPSLFLCGFALTLVLLGSALIAIGRRVYHSTWTVAALVLACTLRHRITRTGANTLEGYFHPRALAFAIGLAGLAAMLRGRPWVAAALVAGAAFVHPTTALWFAVWVGVAVIVAEPLARKPFLAAAGLAAVASAWLMWLGPIRHNLVVMDQAWRSILALKDYLFPTEWPLSAWFVNLGYVAVIVLVYEYRRRHNLTVAREAGLVAGCLALVTMFLVSLPFVAAPLAFAVQLQVPRIFWMADLLATVYLVWLLAESPLWRRWRRQPETLARIIFGVVLAAALGRGAYVMLVEHPERPLIAYDLAPGPWRETMEWVRSHTAARAHVLADPGHAWRYGTSVRVAGQRDVLLEEVKDAAIAMYSRDVALRVGERIEAIGDFGQLTVPGARALRARYDLDYLVSDRPFDLPVAYRNARFTVYRLKE